MTNRKSLLFVISAPSGTGKTTVSEQIFKVVDNLIPSISHTTRSPRSGEVNGKDYYFISREEFKTRIEANEFVEWNEYHGNQYGSSLINIEKAKKQGKDLLFDIDVNGAANIKRKFNNGIYIFILPPSLNTLRERLVERGTDSKESIENRISIAKKEMQHYHEYDYIIMNHEINEAARQIASIIFAERCRTDNLTIAPNGLIN